jgi:hypothetical protein
VTQHGRALDDRCRRRAGSAATPSIRLVTELAALRPAMAAIFTSAQQSCLPLALLLRLVG